MAQKVKFRANRLDKFINEYFPVIGARRMHAKFALAKAGAHVGASKNRKQTINWDAPVGDSDEQDLFDLPDLRARSKDLVRNTPLATGAINTKVTNVVGSGLKLRSQIDREFLGLSDKEADEWQENVEREWLLWAESDNCSQCGNANIYELQDLVFRSTLIGGDCFVLYPYLNRKHTTYQLAVNLIEAERVCNSDNAIDSKTLSGGIERDENGTPVNYHILKSNPHSLVSQNKEWIKVAPFGEKSGRRNVSHLYRKLHIGQSRGLPDLSPVMETLKQLGNYTEAEIDAAVVSGLFTTFVKTKDGQGLDPLVENNSNNADSAIKMDSGAIIGLAEGEDIETANPGRPNTAFDPFVQAILRQVGVALELPFELLIKHFTKSYSAARAALLEAWKFFSARRKWLVMKFCMPIYENFLIEAISKGRVYAPGFLNGDPAIRAAYLRSEWHGDAKGHIQPKQEIEADKIAVDMGVKTLDQVCAESTGGNFNQKHKQLVKEKRMREEDGLIESAESPLQESIPIEEEDADKLDEQLDNDEPDNEETDKVDDDENT